MRPSQSRVASVAAHMGGPSQGRTELAAFVGLSAFATDPVQQPRLRHATKFNGTYRLERYAAVDEDVLHGCGDEDLVLACSFADPRRDMHRNPTNIAVYVIDGTDVDTRPQLYRQSARCTQALLCRNDRLLSGIEDGEKAVTDALDDCAGCALDGSPNQPIMLSEQLSPAVVAEPSGQFC